LFFLGQEAFNLAMGILQSSTSFCNPITIVVSGIERFENVIGDSFNDRVYLKPVVQAIILNRVKLSNLFISDCFELEDIRMWACLQVQEADLLLRRFYDNPPSTLNFLHCLAMWF
jgi:hypothetical protein